MMLTDAIRLLESGANHDANTSSTASTMAKRASKQTNIDPMLVRLVPILLPQSMISALGNVAWELLELGSRHIIASKFE